MLIIMKHKISYVVSYEESSLSADLNDNLSMTRQSMEMLAADIQQMSESASDSEPGFRLLIVQATVDIAGDIAATTSGATNKGRSVRSSHSTRVCYYWELWLILWSQCVIIGSIKVLVY